MVNKLVITAAIVGAEVSRQDNPNLPLNPEEIAQAAIAAGEAGAAIIHLHARDSNGTPTQSKEVFRRTMDLIKRYSKVILQVSTGGTVGMTLAERLQPISLRPEMATLTTGSVNFGQAVFCNSPEDIRSLALELAA